MQFGKSNNDDEVKKGMLVAGMNVRKHDKEMKGAELETMVASEFETICDRVYSQYNKHGFYPATLVGYGEQVAFQLDAEPFGRTPEPKLCTYAILQHLIKKSNMDPKAFVLIVEMATGPEPEYHEEMERILVLTLTTCCGYGDHKVRIMKVKHGDQKRAQIIDKGETKFIYQLESPFGDIWKVWNPEESFGQILSMGTDVNMNDLDDMRDMFKDFKDEREDDQDDTD